MISRAAFQPFYPKVCLFLIMVSAGDALSQTTLTGDYVIAGNGTSPGNLTLPEGNLAVSQGSISAGEVISAMLELQYGTTTTNLPAGGLSYQTGAKQASFGLSEQNASFLWSDGAYSSSRSKMLLGSNNVLSLFKSNGSSVGAVLDPNTSRLTLSDNGGGIYNSAGNAVMQIGSNGTASFPGAAVFAQGVQVAGELASNGRIVSGEDGLINNVTVGRGPGGFAENAVLGIGALEANVSGRDIVAIGYRALASNTQAYSNVAIGRQALTSNTVGDENVGIGQAALYHNTSGYCNIAMARGALFLNTSGANNIAMGVGSLRSNTTGSYNLAFGVETLTSNTIGIYNTATGVRALSWNTEGSYNVATGGEALVRNSTGTLNTAVGTSAGQFNSNGSRNVMVGWDAGSYQSNGATLSAAQNSIYIGMSSRGYSDSDSNSIVIGSNAVGEGANTTVIGNSSTSKSRIYGTLHTPGIETGQIKISGTNSAIYNSAGDPVFQIDPSGAASFPGEVTFAGPVSSNGNPLATEQMALQIASLAIDGKLTSGDSLVLGGGAASGMGTTAISNGIAFGNSASAIAGGGAMADYSVALSAGSTFGAFSTAMSGGYAYGEYSFVAGLGTLADTESEMALGTYNSPVADSVWDKQTLFSVGNGTDHDHRSNAIGTLKNGKTTLSNKFWTASTPTLVPVSSASSEGNALTVEGHTALKGNTVLAGKVTLQGQVTLEQPQGDIGMGIYE